MNIIIKFLFVICLLFSGCATKSVQHTIYQQQIIKKQEKLTDDAKDLLVKASQMLTINSGSLDIKRVQSLLEHSQSLLGVDVDDGKELKDLSGEALDEAVDKIIKEDEKEKKSIADLKKKDEETVSKIIADNIKVETIKEYERGKAFKFYAICTGVVGVLGFLIYLYPLKFLSIGSSIISFFFRK